MAATLEGTSLTTGAGVCGGVEGATARMSGSGFQLSLLRDGRLAPLATSALPAWLWSTGWHPHRVGERRTAWPFSGHRHPRRSARAGSRAASRRPARSRVIAATLSPGAAPRLERLRGFGAGIGRALTCACSHIVLADDTASRSRGRDRTCRPRPAARRARRPLARRRPGTDRRLQRRRAAHCRHRRRARAPSRRDVARRDRSRTH